MTMPKKTKGPAFVRYAVPVLDRLKELGASRTAGEVVDRVIERCDVVQHRAASSSARYH